MLRAPLYPYQQEGMLHLAFSGRALLADEMGLGKTIQAIAACELLRRLRGIERVLVVAPASLKAEWEEQIAKFTALPALVIQGPRALRLKQYRQASFFYLLNYEQVRPDRREINEVLAADVIVLDEAQRIKNWQTRTAEAVKRLTSRYAFVLTGTPVENRIDEIYSIVQFLDPSIFGPLFQFNRDFYALDERGRPVGYKNLDELHRRLRPLMLRRRKDEVEDQLPGRTVNTYFVAMAPEQATRYEEYETRVARLMAQAKRRPLLREEMEKLQKWLACMRMLCDTPYILDRDCRVAPKIDELKNVLDELLEGGDPKLIVFSEWERMLELVRVICEERDLSYAWHTGSVPQEKRRKEIRRFKDDPGCRLFLSTDAGSVGHNLQAANVVINLDLPWNPAKLEQRIARAWRKHQKRQVQVINLV
ncbi:MAG: DEAD/DEAH box helicase, partial [Gammaproteobacteria bacterium]